MTGLSSMFQGKIGFIRYVHKTYREEYICVILLKPSKRGTPSKLNFKRKVELFERGASLNNTRGLVELLSQSSLELNPTNLAAGGGGGGTASYQMGFYRTFIMENFTMTCTVMRTMDKTFLILI